MMAVSRICLHPTSRTPHGSLVSFYALGSAKGQFLAGIECRCPPDTFLRRVVENATSLLVRASVRIPKLNRVFCGFYGRFCQSPPLDTVSGPRVRFVTNQNLGFGPLRGERDQKHPFGVTIPFQG
jgi:hypothetical protein